MLREENTNKWTDTLNHKTIKGVYVKSATYVTQRQLDERLHKGKHATFIVIDHNIVVLIIIILWFMILPIYYSWTMIAMMMKDK